jgi:GNAT superfamily N-acetyltransferase
MCESVAARANVARLKRMLEQVNEALREAEAEADVDTAAPPAPAADAPASSADGTAAQAVHVVIGTSAMARADPTLVARIAQLVNRAYTAQLKDLLPEGQEYTRLDEEDVEDRLEMGDAGPRANRVLHLAWRGGELVGACSSTLQPPWTEEGCGHWGLMAVDPCAQGTGVASTLVRAAEARVASRQTEIQIEYEYTHGHAPSQRLMDWYEGKLGYECVSGGFRRRMQTEFRKCRKLVPPELARTSRAAYLRELRELIAADLAAAEQPEAAAEPEEDDLLVGREVTLVGLSAKPELNGSGGVVLQRDSQSGRWGVQLASGRRVALRRENLQLTVEEEEADADDGE